MIVSITKEITILEFQIFSILSLVEFWQYSPLSNFNRKLTRSVFRLDKWSSTAKLLSASKLEKIKTSSEISISINYYCANM